eukprot:COSAG02_NODE_613_length_19522_cov_13.355249_4_plen_191_part_00
MLGLARRAHLTCVFRMREIGHFAFRMFRISHVSHFAARNRTFRISRREIGHFAFRGAKSRRETGHSGMTKYQMEDGARHSPRVSGAVIRRWALRSCTRPGRGGAWRHLSLGSVYVAGRVGAVCVLVCVIVLHRFRFRCPERAPAPPPWPRSLSPSSRAIIASICASDDHLQGGLRAHESIMTAIYSDHNV